MGVSTTQAVIPQQPAEPKVTGAQWGALISLLLGLSMIVIDGSVVFSDRWGSVINPATEEVLGEFAIADERLINRERFLDEDMQSVPEQPFRHRQV